MGRERRTSCSAIALTHQRRLEGDFAGDFARDLAAAAGYLAGDLAGDFGAALAGDFLAGDFAGLVAGLCGDLAAAAGAAGFAEGAASALLALRQSTIGSTQQTRTAMSVGSCAARSKAMARKIWQTVASLALCRARVISVNNGLLRLKPSCRGA